MRIKSLRCKNSFLLFFSVQEIEDWIAGKDDDKYD